MLINNPQECSPRSIARSYGLTALSAFFVAEFFVLTGAAPGFADKIVMFGGITSYGLPMERQRELAVHLLAQTLAFPAYFIVTYKGLKVAVHNGTHLGVRAVLSGLFLSILFSLLLYMPARSTPNPNIHKFNLVHIAIQEFNIAYSSMVGLFLIGIAAGLQIPPLAAYMAFKNTKR
ncbi:hypothetical protein IM816_16350 [Luteibacter flocculans]|uniref:DUF4149 domain-containing protein n=1 Tax=Luteibacter flocculans TaxID=2780091 RepID=A0ABY4T225_9GAMM|nr:hypothetical protein [Luteibacter flocculans]URL58150.1 hypothetical protein IM816_16350 [Luteibacter flocculans]